MSSGDLRGNFTLGVHTIVAVVVAFFICWAPFHAQRLLAVHAKNKNTKSPVVATVYAILTYLSGILYYLSTTVNPVLYHIMSHKFREAFKATLRQQCGRKRKRMMKNRTYSVLSRQNMNNCNNQVALLHRLPSTSDEAPPPCQQQKSEFLMQKINNNTSPQGSQKGHTRQRSNTAENAWENLNHSFPVYHPRQRVPSNSSQTTMTTSIGKLSLGEGNNNFRSDPTLAITQCEEIDKRHVKQNEKCNDSTKENSDKIVHSSSTMSKHNEDCDCQDCRIFKANGISVTSPKRSLFRSASGVSALSALTRKLRALSVSTKSIFIQQHKSLVNVDSLKESSVHRNRVTSDGSLNSAKSENTISNSSLQDLDENEFVSAELALYMGELNEQKV